jgi:histidyl-tRNA synthetase
MEDPTVSVVIIPFDNLECKQEAIVLAAQIRQYQIPTIVDARPIKLKLKLRHAANLKTFYSIIIGQEEIANKSCQIKDMDEGKQLTISLANAAKYIADDYWSEPVALDKLLKSLTGFEYG